MKPSDDIIEKFQKIYFEEFKEEISKDDAYEKFLRLVNFVRAILKPQSPKDQIQKESDSFLLQFDQQSKNGKLN